MIDRFVLITTESTYAILLRLVYSFIDIVFHYDIVLCRYQKRLFLS